MARVRWRWLIGAVGMMAGSAGPAPGQDVAGPGEAWVLAVLGEQAAASGTFVCSERTYDDEWTGSCHHPGLSGMIELERNVERGSGFGERLCRLMEQVGVEAPVGSLEIVASGVIGEDRVRPDSVEVYRLLYFPHATEASLGISEVDPDDGRPWLHHAGECRAHVMWSEWMRLN